MKKLKNSVKLRLALVACYCMIALMPIVGFLMTYSTSLDFLIQREVDVQAQLMSNNMNLLEASLGYADTYMYSLVSTQCMQTYLASSPEPSNRLISAIRSMHDAFPIFNDQNKLITHAYVYGSKNDTIIDRSSAYLHLAQHYEKVFAIEGMTLEEWREQVLQDDSAFRFLCAPRAGGGSRLIYSRVLPAYPLSAGRILFEIDPQRVLTLLSSGGGVQKDTALYGPQATLLAGEHFEGTNLKETYGEFSGYQQLRGADGKQRLLFASSLPAYGLTLYSLIPRAYFTDYALRTSMGILLRLAPFSLLACVILFFTVRYSRLPLEAAIQSAADPARISTLNPFKFIQQSLHELSRTNREQEKLLQDNRFEMQNALLSMLVTRRLSEDYPLEDKLAEAGFRLSAPYMMGLILVAYSSQENGDIQPISGEAHAQIRQLALKYEPAIRYLKMDGPYHLLFLASMEDSENRRELLHDRLMALCEEIGQMQSDDIHIYLGNECHSVNRLGYSFNTARAMISSKAPNRCLIDSEQSRAACLYDYSGSDATYLRQKASSGDAEAVCARLHELLERNRTGHTPFEYQLLYGKMLSSLLEAGYDGPLDDKILYELERISPEVFFRMIEEYYVALCQSNLKEEEEGEKQLVDQLLREIEEKLGDYNLCQADIAFKFTLTERRLSALIRQYTGLTFSKYLEKLRMEKAKELLADTNLTVEKIAYQVGYGSDASFRRAFKHFTGSSPSDNRK